VGAKGLLMEATRSEVLGYLAKEFCHNAIHFAFDNGCKPYKRKQAMTVGMDYFRMWNQYNCVSAHTKYALNERWYSGKLAELILVAPQLLAQYSNDEEMFEHVRGTHKDLFSFYEQNVLPEVESAREKVKKSTDKAIKKFVYGRKNKTGLWKKIGVVVAIVLSLSMMLVCFTVHTTSILYDESLLKVNSSLLLVKPNMTVESQQDQ
jgi:hypothetical protein